MKSCLAFDIIKRIDYLGEDAQTATETACKNMTEKSIGTGGAITIDNKGKVGVSFTSKKMARQIYKFFEFLLTKLFRLGLIKN